MHDKRGFNPQTRHTYFLEFPTPIAIRTEPGGRPDKRGRPNLKTRPSQETQSPEPGPDPGQSYFFWGLNQIPV